MRVEFARKETGLLECGLSWLVACSGPYRSVSKKRKSCQQELKKGPFATQKGWTRRKRELKSWRPPSPSLPPSPTHPPTTAKTDLRIGRSSASLLYLQETVVICAGEQGR
uniref:Uncharacterized protein n=1 Tax=Mesocestoides corti TaxID=53468 RepID=A0A5K3G1Q9_MESCO